MVGTGPAPWGGGGCVTPPRLQLAGCTRPTPMPSGSPTATTPWGLAPPTSLSSGCPHGGPTSPGGGIDVAALHFIFWAPCLGLAWAPSRAPLAPPLPECWSAPQGPRPGVRPLPDICKVHGFQLEPREGPGALALVGPASSFPALGLRPVKGPALREKSPTGARTSPPASAPLPPSSTHSFTPYYNCHPVWVTCLGVCQGQGRKPLLSSGTDNLI